MIKKTLYQRKFIISLTIIFVISLMAILRNFIELAKWEYKTIPAQKKDLKQTIYLEGNIISDFVSDLNFPISGKIKKINYQKGSEIKKGDILAELESDEIQKELEKAQNLKKKMEEASSNISFFEWKSLKEEIKKLEIDLAKRNLENKKSWSDYEINRANIFLSNNEKSFSGYKKNLEKSQDDYKYTFEKEEEKLDRINKTLKEELQKSSEELITQLAEMDKILGINDPKNIEKYKNLLASLAPTSLDRAKIAYSNALSYKKEIEAKISNLENNTTISFVKILASQMENALFIADKALIKARVVLINTGTSQDFTENDLAGLKAKIDESRKILKDQNTKIKELTESLGNSEVVAKTNISFASSSLAIQKDKFLNIKKSLTLSREKLNTLEIKLVETIKKEQENLKQKQKELQNIMNEQSDEFNAEKKEILLSKISAIIAASKNNLNKTKIFSPLDGIITEVSAEVGNQKNSREKIFSIIFPELLIKASAPIKYWDNLREGQEVLTSFGTFPDKIYKGYIEQIEDGFLDDDLVDITIILDEARDRIIYSGMSAGIWLVGAKKEEALAVTKEAIKNENGALKVEILKFNYPVKKNIEIGIIGDNGWVEITYGLKEGEMVILEKSKR